MHEDIRLLTLKDWLEHDLLLDVVHCEPASSDASFRRYFRVILPNQQYVVMDAPPDKENIAAFVKVGELLANAGVHVPAIYEQNLEDGFLLLEDFGHKSFLDCLHADNADALYQSAFDSLFRLQVHTDVPQGELPCYDEALLTRELAIFDDWFLGQLLDIEMPGSIRQPLHQHLIESALAQPKQCVHRDYHSRNLMVLDDASPGVLDFQDAVLGPITYDIVSLLRDCYVAWPDERIDHWLSGYYRRLAEVALVDCGLAQFKRWFDWMGMQRHLKAIGIFSRLKLRDGKTGYLKDIPRTLSYVVQQTQKYPEMSEFGQFLQKRVVPEISRVL